MPRKKSSRTSKRAADSARRSRIKKSAGKMRDKLLRQTSGTKPTKNERRRVRKKTVGKKK